jgi:NTE family protein
LAVAMIGIAFEGCACRAAFHAGVAAALAEAKVPVTLTAGASSGSLCAAAVAAGRSHELPERFRALGDRSIICLRRVLWNRSPFDMSYLVRTAVLEALGTVDLRQQPIEALVVATRVRGLKPVVYSSKTEPALLEPLLGSCFVPLLYGRPVRVRGEWLVDGGLTDNLPIERLVERGVDDVIAVVTSHRGTAFKGPLQPRWNPRVSGARVHVVHPRQPLELRAWDLGMDRICRAIDEGYRSGRDFSGS